jgi:hypothetical protein
MPISSLDYYKKQKKSSTAFNLGLNVESTLPTIHMHLYRNYKHKLNILTFLYKKYAHEIIKQGEKIKLNWNAYRKSKV